MRAKSELSGRTKAEQDVPVERKPPWDVRVLAGARSDGRRLFKGNPQGLAVAIDYCKALAYFPDSRPVNGAGQVVDMDFEKVEKEIFYRLKIEDSTFEGKKLRVFFWVQTGTGMIWILGSMWRPDAYKPWVKAKMRTRVNRIINGKA